MHILYTNQVDENDLDQDQREILRELRDKEAADGQQQQQQDDSHQLSYTERTKDFSTAQEWVQAFFTKGAEEVLSFYADDFVWEDVEFSQTITTKEELYKAFVVFNNSGPDSPFGVHKFEVLSYDGAKTAPARAQVRTGGMPDEWNAQDYHRFADNIAIGADFEYDEWGYMQWIWKATHNEDFFGMPAKGKTTFTRGTTTQFYRNGKIVRCRTHWNFREFAMQLGLIPPPDEGWRNNPDLPSA